MPYKSKAQAAYMHIHHPEIAKRWDAEGKGKVNNVYRTGSPVAHKNMSLDPTGYVNREVNKGKRIQKSKRRSGMAKRMIAAAAKRRASVGRPEPSRPPIPVR